jgi:hypothetical protein
MTFSIDALATVLLRNVVAEETRVVDFALPIAKPEELLVGFYFEKALRKLERRRRRLVLEDPAPSAPAKFGELVGFDGDGVFGHR